MVYNSNGAKSSYRVCAGEIHRRVMEILCAGSCRGNARGMRWERGGKVVSLSFSASFPFASFSFSRAAATANPRIRVVMGYGYLQLSDRRGFSLSRLSLAADYYCQYGQKGDTRPRQWECKLGFTARIVSYSRDAWPNFFLLS